MTVLPRAVLYPHFVPRLSVICTTHMSLYFSDLVFHRDRNTDVLNGPLSRGRARYWHYAPCVSTGNRPIRV